MRFCDLRTGQVWRDLHPGGGVQLIVEADERDRSHRWTWLLCPEGMTSYAEGHVFSTVSFTGEREKLWTRDDLRWERIV